ncbi:hypothetical protein D9758_012819 [Tetrapyrgos nigripes]|uniref:Helitron helicase-like domain-containing protein n=1 Tax=Tetrapyrgos nigripes TaxID=182062 RepID=A0A8H5CZA2_9AGAR|nr:hypothetical protein D9758_012819 [Tetrapyrgos nigripes]
MQFSKSWDWIACNHHAGNSDMLHRHNGFVTLYKSAYQCVRELQTNNPENIQNITIKLHFNFGRDPRTHNLPTVDEVAILLPGREEVTDHRDIILHTQAGSLKRLYETNPAYMALHYVLLFPREELGWHPKLKLSQEHLDANNITVDEGAVDWEEDLEDPEAATSGSRKRKQKCLLFQQFVVDASAQTEQSRLRFLHLNQAKLRSEVYNGLVDAMNNGDVNLENLSPHTEREQMVIFHEEQGAHDILNQAQKQKTTLMGWFEANADEKKTAAEHPDQATTIA